MAGELTQILVEALETPKPLSILELKGLGRDAWTAAGAARHIRRERDSWD